ncbi:HAD-IIA family hydrolase [Methylocaldum sp. MU1018]
MFKPAFLLDMDGVLYRGDRAIPEAQTFLRAIADFPYLLVTNNSSATPEALTQKLARLGFPEIDPARILTSALATAAFLQAEKPGFTYFPVGGSGLHEALRRYGTEDAAAPDYVVVGEGEGLTYETLTLGIDRLICGKAALIGTNPDPILDGTRNGRDIVLPGGGALIAPFAAAAGIEPLFVGKPERWLFLEALRRLKRSAGEAIMIGDRPDTDITGAARLNIVTVLVRTGRFPPGEPYPDDLPEPDFDIDSLSELDLGRVLRTVRERRARNPESIV